MLFRISGQTWDEGTGYDYANEVVPTLQDDNNITFVEGASNWYLCHYIR